MKTPGARGRTRQAQQQSSEMRRQGRKHDVSSASAPDAIRKHGSFAVFAVFAVRISGKSDDKRQVKKKDGGAQDGSSRSRQDRVVSETMKLFRASIQTKIGKRLGPGLLSRGRNG